MFSARNQPKKNPHRRVLRDHVKYTRGRPGEENTPAWSDNQTCCEYTITKRCELAKRSTFAVFSLYAGCGNYGLLNSIKS